MSNNLLPIPQRVVVAEKNLERVISWISNSDAKIAVVLAFQGGMIAFLSTKGKEIVDVLASYTRAPAYDLLLVSLISFVCFFSWSVYAAFQALYPDIKFREQSPFFFGSIASMGQIKYKQTMRSLTEETAEEEINDQVYINSEIATAKFNNVKISIKALLAASIFWLFILILLPIFSTNKTNYPCNQRSYYDTVCHPNKQ